jgi:ATP-dependent exoDNAse (exonuclease V) beta subunit
MESKERRTGIRTGNEKSRNYMAGHIDEMKGKESKNMKDLEHSKTDYADSDERFAGLTVYNASAGSGKTYTLTLEYLRLALSDPHNARKFREILAVTFTNKATDEMKTRIIETLYGLANDKAPSFAEKLARRLEIDALTLRERAARVLRALLHNYSDFSISTIDKFFQRILHAFVREAGLKPGFRLELDKERLMSQAVDKMLANIADKPALYRRMSELIDERIERGNAWDVAKMLRQRGEEVLKESFGRFDAEFHAKIRDAEFMNRYAGEIQTVAASFESEMDETGARAAALIESAGIEFSDFKYGGQGTSNYFRKIRTRDCDDYVPGVRIRAILESGDGEAWCTKKLEARKREALLGIAGELTLLLGRATNLYNERYAEYLAAVCAKNSMKSLWFLAEIENAVGEIAGSENIMPIGETTRMLETLIGNADAPFVYERVGTKYSTFMIDEFQDTSEAQWNNFRPLLRNSLAEGKFSLVVGDVKQSIYRWRNGDWQILARRIFSEFADLRLSVENLDTNWRSLPEIVLFNNALFSALPAFAERNSGVDDASLLGAAYSLATQKPAPSAKGGGYVEITATKDSDETKARSEFLAALPALIADIQDRGYRASDTAILVRKSADGQAVSERLMQYRQTSGDTKHCFEILSQDSLFIETSDTVRFVVALFRALAEPDDPINNALINRFLNKSDPDPRNVARLDARAQTAVAEAERLSMPEAFELFVSTFGLGDNAIEIPYLQELHDHVVAFADRELPDVSAFLEHWDNKGASLRLSAGRMPDAINILTIHKSKGLEYPVVIVPFCDWRMRPDNDVVWIRPVAAPFSALPHLPVTYNGRMAKSLFADDYKFETLQALIDNLNLMYVAFTRASSELHVMLPLPATPKSKSNAPDLLRTAATALNEFFESAAAEFCDGRLRIENPDDRTVKYSLGTKGKEEQEGEKEKEVRGMTVTKYVSASSSAHKLRLRYESAGYFDPAANRMKPLNYGTLMHRIFSMINTVSDLPKAMKRIAEEGLIAAADLDELHSRTLAALQFAEEWFADDSPYSVVTERFMILPPSMNMGVSRKPDRVMSSAAETIVIDFKFGTTKNNAHKRQVENYVRILRKMNYPDARGYVWYVDLGCKVVIR